MRRYVALFQTLKLHMFLIETEGKENWNLVFEAKVEVGQHVQTW